MTRAVTMTKDQIAELVGLAREDAALWAELKDRELEIEKRLADAAKQGREVDDPGVVLDAPKFPTMGMMVSELVKRRRGANENFYHGSLKMELRRCVRVELGLPV